MIKRVFQIPCPSCGTTRAVEMLLQGDFLKSIHINPLSLIVLPTMLVVPCWIVYDFITKRTSFHQFYRYMEKQLRKPLIYAPLILLILLLWGWNIYKIT
ncbi:MAG: DUF2752 domain-containing protein [Bacteroidales bacterium]|nr:DUF2752 domain-containing protein [Bacteroidales bacterium]